MMRRRFLIAASLMIIVLFYGTAHAQSPVPQPPAVSVGAILLTLLFCGLMGLVGQGCRVIVGLATMATSNLNVPPTSQDSFNLSRLVFSLIIGFIAGFVTALAQWKLNTITAINVSDFNTVLGFAVAGYIGTDVVEAFTVQFFEKSKSIAEAVVAPASSISSASEGALSQKIDDLSSTVVEVHSAITTLASLPQASVAGTDYPAWALSRDIKVARSDYWPFIMEAATTFTLPVSVILGIGSKESHWGTDLTPPGPAGTGDWTPRDPKKWGSAMPTDKLGWGRGLMQIDWYSHDFAKTGNWSDAHDNILFGCGLLADTIKSNLAKAMAPDTALLSAISAYNGQSGPKSLYCLDVMARANWISQQGLDQ